MAITTSSSPAIPSDANFDLNSQAIDNANASADAKALNKTFNANQQQHLENNIKDGRNAQTLLDRDLGRLGGAETGVASLAKSDAVASPNATQFLQALWHVSARQPQEVNSQQALAAFQPLRALLGKPQAGATDSALTLGQGHWPLTPMGGQAQLAALALDAQFMSLPTIGTSIFPDTLNPSTADSKPTVAASGQPDPQIVARVAFVQRVSSMMSKTLNAQLAPETMHSVMQQLGNCPAGLLSPFMTQMPEISAALKGAWSSMVASSGEVQIPNQALSLVENAVGKAFGKAGSFAAQIKVNSGAISAVLSDYLSGNTQAINNAAPALRSLVLGVMSWNGMGGGTPGDTQSAQTAGADVSAALTAGTVPGSVTSRIVADAQASLTPSISSSIDIDMLVMMVMGMAAEEQTSELQDTMADMQKHTLQKQAARQKEEALNDASTSMTQKMTQQYNQAVASGALSPKVTFEQYEASCQVVWGDGVTDDATGTYTAPQPYLQDPPSQSLLDQLNAAANPPKQTATAMAGANPFGLSDVQYSYLSEMYNQLPNKDLYPTLAHWLTATLANGGLGLKNLTGDSDPLTDAKANVTAAASWASANQPATPASGVAAVANDATSHKNLQTVEGIVRDKMIETCLEIGGLCDANLADVDVSSLLSDYPLSTEDQASLMAWINGDPSAPANADGSPGSLKAELSVVGSTLSAVSSAATTTTNWPATTTTAYALGPQGLTMTSTTTTTSPPGNDPGWVAVPNSSGSRGGGQYTKTTTVTIELPLSPNDASYASLPAALKTALVANSPLLTELLAQAPTMVGGSVSFGGSVFVHSIDAKGLSTLSHVMTQMSAASEDFSSVVPGSGASSGATATSDASGVTQAESAQNLAAMETAYLGDAANQAVSGVDGYNGDPSDAAVDPSKYPLSSADQAKFNAWLADTGAQGFCGQMRTLSGFIGDITDLRPGQSLTGGGEIGNIGLAAGPAPGLVINYNNPTGSTWKQVTLAVPLTESTITGQSPALPPQLQAELEKLIGNQALSAVCGALSSVHNSHQLGGTNQTVSGYIAFTNDEAAVAGRPPYHPGTTFAQSFVTAITADGKSSGFKPTTPVTAAATGDGSTTEPARPTPDQLEADYRTAFGTVSTSGFAGLIEDLPKNSNGQYYDPGNLTDDEHSALQGLVSAGVFVLGPSQDALDQQSTIASMDAAQFAAYQAKNPTLNHSGTIAMLTQAASDAKDTLDGLSDMDAQMQMELQMKMDQYSKLMEAMSNLMKKAADTSQTIVENVK